ncbi:MAG: hypothetical protein AB1467_01345 [Candidatus Diapherotrites archaeon]
MEKKEVLLESIRRLFQLNVSDEEIVIELQDVGLSAEDARELIREARGETKAQQAVQPKKLSEMTAEERRDFRATRRGGKAEEIMIPQEVLKQAEKAISQKEKQTEKELTEEEEPEEVEEEVKAGPPRKTKEKFAGREKPGGIWEKGILTTINEKLEEIEGIEENINKVMDSKLQKLFEKEAKKNKVLFDSEYSLLLEKINSTLAQKTEEFNKMMKAKMLELDKASKNYLDLMQKESAKKQITQGLIEELNSKIEDITKTRKKMQEQFSAEIDKVKAQSASFSGNIEGKIDEMEEKINKALELEVKITEGLVADAEDKIKEFISRKEGEITKEFSGIKGRPAQQEDVTRFLAEVKKLDSFKQSLQDQVTQSKNELENIKGELKKLIAAQMVEASTETENKINELFEERKDELKAFGKDLTKKLNLNEFAQKMEELNLFKDQFIKMIDKNVSELKQTRQEIEEETDKKSKLIDSKINAVDRKMKELAEFEKNFAKEMGLQVEKLIEKKKKSAEVKMARKLIPKKAEARKLGKKALRETIKKVKRKRKR